METKFKFNISNISKNPYFGLIGIILGLIGIILSIFFYVGSKKESELTFMVNPIKTSIVSSGRTSSIKVFNAEKEITNDVTAVQIAIWNGGAKSIRTNNILEPIEIYTDPPVSIIEATILNTSREVTNFHIETDKLEQGIIKLKWKILEQNDGASIQIIFIGAKDTKFNFRGTIEGQAQIFDFMNINNQIIYLTSLIYSKKRLREKEFGLEEFRTLWKLLTGMVLLLSLIPLTMAIDRHKRKRYFFAYGYFFGFLIMLFLALVYWFLTPPYSPIPF
ncbi:MAG: hypothetical protein O3A78_07390 [Nitrospinae bacterium]|jgi:hypothetical protein|nr:hypothetical protein [Nitrospinota bacterium]MDA1109625.1 hypothetical protein [Nitrospinota bacterium]